jgi:hypothetical protein
LVSAFIVAEPPSRVLEEVIDARLELVLPQPVMVELERILTGKLGFETQRWRGVEELLVDLAAELVPAPETPPEAVTGDPADDVILACGPSMESSFEPNAKVTQTTRTFEPATADGEA